MLGNCERMVVIPSRTNEWTQSTQSQIDDHKVNTMASSRVMEKAGQELLQQQQQPLKCPRCDSSNTKFCYYNNYSLSQPRHFCKACKRYWTRGGTLRNVPVGGGCRKNKRVKRQTNSSSVDTTTASPSSPSTPNPPCQPQIDIIASTSNHFNPLFYNSCDVMNNVSFPRYDLQPQMNNALGFMSSEADDNGYRIGFGNSDHNNLLSSYNSIFGSSTSSTPTNPVMASLLSSTLLQQKFINGGVKDGSGSNTYHGLAPLQGMQVVGNGSEVGMMASKELKGEGQNRLERNNGACQNQIEHMGFSDPSLYWNTATTIGAWSDQPNIGPSVTSLI